MALVGGQSGRYPHSTNYLTEEEIQTNQQPTLFSEYEKISAPEALQIPDEDLEKMEFFLA